VKRREARLKRAQRNREGNNGIQGKYGLGSRIIGQGKRGAGRRKRERKRSGGEG